MLASKFCFDCRNIYCSSWNQSFWGYSSWNGICSLMSIFSYDLPSYLSAYLRSINNLQPIISHSYQLNNLIETIQYSK